MEDDNGSDEAEAAKGDGVSSLGAGPAAWLRNSLSTHARTAEFMSKRARAYARRLPAMAGAAERLAAAYADAALVYRRALRELDAADGTGPSLLCGHPACEGHRGPGWMCGP